MLSSGSMRRDAAEVCRHVAEGAPILSAAREDAPDPSACEWRFGCGAANEDGDGRVQALEDVVRADPTAAEIVLHRRGTTLGRGAAGARWRTESGPVLFPHRPSRRHPRFDPRYPPRPGEALDGRDLRVMADVSEWGWHTVRVADEGSLPYAFSVGLFRSFDHAEVVLFGLPADHLVSAVGRVAARVRDGERFEHGDVAGDIVEGHAVAVRRVVPRHYPAHLGYAIWYHGGPRFPAVQLVWADDAGRFPWDRWFSPAHRDAQPLLYEPEPA